MWRVGHWDFEVRCRGGSGSGGGGGARATVTRSSASHRRAQRERQIAIGKRTDEYDAYILDVPVTSRGRDHPRTPDPVRPSSKRAFDGRMRVWRRALHAWDDGCGGVTPAASGGGRGVYVAGVTAASKWTLPAAGVLRHNAFWCDN